MERLDEYELAEEMVQAEGTATHKQSYLTWHTHRYMLLMTT
jgi:hypothetical protein